jgi:hypothetical protein
VLRAGHLRGGRRHDVPQQRLGREVRLQLAGQLAQLAREPGRAFWPVLPTACRTGSCRSPAAIAPSAR